VTAGARALRVLLVTFGSVTRPRGGLAVRARTTLDALSSLGHEVTVLSSAEPEGPLAPPLPGSLVVLRGGLVMGWSRELTMTVRKNLEAADLVIVESALLLPAVVMASPRVPLVWDTNECETLHYRRLPATIDNRLRGAVWRRLEAWASRRVDLAVAIGAEEETWWRRLFPRLRDKTMSVEHRAFVPPGYAGTRVRPSGVPPSDRMLLFVGNLIGKQNAAAAEWLVNTLAQALPTDTTLVLAGPGTNHLGASKQGDGRVLCLGNVEDIDSLIAAADLCLAPVGAGAGVKTKVLHYLAHGRPVLGTEAAFEGIAGAPGTIQRRLDEWPGALAGALSSGASKAGVREAQGRWYEEHCALPVIARQWQAVLDQALLRPRGAS
jgi:hypothetical protein